MKTKTPKEGAYTEHYSNGQKKLEGCYGNNLREGNWEYWYDDGQEFAKGSFKEGRRDGQWTYWHENGQKSAKGSFTSRSYHYGSKYGEGVGSYQNKVPWVGAKEEQKDGLWTYWHANGLKAAEGNYGGTGLMISGNLIKEKSTYLDSIWKTIIHQKKGSWVYWHPNGSKARKESWDYVHQGRKSTNLIHERGIELAQLVGGVTCWHNNGQKSLEGSYDEDGLMNNLWNEYYPDGYIKSIGHYSMDELLSIEVWNDTHEHLYAHFVNGKRSEEWIVNYPNGETKLKINYCEPKDQTSPHDVENFESFFHGKQVSYYTNGQKAIELNFEFGKKHGIASTWHKNGQVEAKEVFINGKLDGDVTKWNSLGEKILEDKSDYWKGDWDDLEFLDIFFRIQKIWTTVKIEKILSAERYSLYTSVYDVEKESNDSTTGFECNGTL